jgi:hypothetical protein
MSYTQSCSATGSPAHPRQSLNNNVTKLRASDGVVLGTFTVGSGADFPHYALLFASRQGL